jgi:hypothetical protein
MFCVSVFLVVLTCKLALIGISTCSYNIMNNHIQILSMNVRDLFFKY